MDSVSIPQVEIESNRLIKSTQSYDSLLETNGSKSVGDLLISKSNVQVQQYGGRGSIQSLSIRGFSSSQNQVNWNGLSVNSLTLGMFDLGGISSGSFDNMTLTKGSSSAQFGSGAVGGTIELGNSAEWDKGISIAVGTEQGSFGANMERYQIGYSNAKFNYNLLYTNEFVKNDYEFINHKKIGKPTEIQKHAEFWNTNIVQELHYRKGKYQLDWVTWLNGKKKNNPKLLTDGSPSQQSRADSTVRSVLKYSRRFKKSKLNLLYGYIGERFRYWDYKANIFTNYWINQQVGEVKYKYFFGKLTSEVKLRSEFQNVHNSNYNGSPNRNQNVISISNYYTINSKFKLIGIAGLQTSSSPVNHTPIGSLGYNWRMFNKQLLIKGNISNHYRYPSFNDLFWASGGNDELLAESGWSIEETFKFSGKKNKSRFIQLDLYYSRIKDWIQWVPNGSFWQPKNVKSVESMGLDASEQFTFSIGPMGISMRSSVSLTNTTVIESNDVNDPALGSQAIYIPKINANSGAEIKWKKAVLEYQLLYKGKRFTTFDNSERSALPAYFLSNVSLHRKSKFKTYALLSKAEVQNVFNQSYQVMSNYAMPGRAYYLTLVLYFNSKKPGKH